MNEWMGLPTSSDNNFSKMRMFGERGHKTSSPALNSCESKWDGTDMTVFAKSRQIFQLDFVWQGSIPIGCNIHTKNPEDPFPMTVAEVPAWHFLNHHVLLLNAFIRLAQRTQGVQRTIKSTSRDFAQLAPSISIGYLAIYLFISFHSMLRMATRVQRPLHVATLLWNVTTHFAIEYY